MSKKILLLIATIILFLCSLSAQIKPFGTPFLVNYSNKDYDAAHQNWAITQDNRGIMYFGNTESILEYDGKEWRKISVTNKTPVLALAKDKNGRIYVGAKSGELGSLQVDSIGQVQYVSLSSKLPKANRNFSRIRDILVSSENKIIFITPLSIFVYSEQKEKFTVFNVQKSANRFVSGMNYKNEVYIQEKGFGLWLFKNNKLEKVKGTEQFKDRWLLAMFPGKNDSITFATNQGSCYFKNGKYTNFKNNNYFNEIFAYQPAENKGYIAGLYSHGAILIDKNLKIKQLLNEKNGLQSNGVYSIYLDKDNIIWLGLANGISAVYEKSPYAYLSSNVGLTETVSNILLHKGRMFVATRNGVFYRQWKLDIFGNKKFKYIDKTKGTQVWVMDTVKGHVLCGSSKGLFEIKDSTHIKILNEFSITSLTRPKKYPNYLFGGGGNGISVFEYKNKAWKFKNQIEGIEVDCRHIKEDNDGTFWVTNKNKGIYHFVFNDSLTKVQKVEFFDSKNGLPSNIGNYVFYVKKEILFATTKGVYKFNNTNQTFIPDNKFNAYFSSLKHFNKIYEDKYGNIWYKEQYTHKKQKTKLQWDLGLLKKEGTSYRLITKPFLKMKNNIHSLKMISEHELIIGAEKGIVYYDLNTKKKYDKEYPVLIRKVHLIANDSVIFGGAYPDSSQNASIAQPENFILSLPYHYNGIAFSFSAIFFEEPDKTQYKFYLEGNEDTWSDWKSDNFKEYANLQPGVYKFIVKARNVYGVESTEAIYKFEILPPFYRTMYAYFFYVIILIILVYSIVKLSIRRVTKQKEILEHIVEKRTAEIKEQNKELSVRQKEIEAKNNMLSEKNEEISQKNKDITSSINYAKRIQQAMLPTYEAIDKAIPKNFILFKPRDIVSGDFYWFSDTPEKTIITAVDCTGHGVPGAFMSMVGSEILTTIATKGISQADQILNTMNLYVRKALKQDENENQDGMDMALCVINKKEKTVDFAGAKNPLVYIQSNELFQIKPSKQSIGGYQTGIPFTKTTVNCDVPTLFYIFSDGFQDQFGGPKQRKFMIKRMKQMLFDNHKKPLSEQKSILENAINSWMENTEQTDDIILIGFKIE